MEKNTQLAAVVIIVVAVAAASIIIVPSLLTPPEEEALKVAVVLAGSVNDFHWVYSMYTHANTLDDELDDVQIDTFTDVGNTATAKDVMRDLASTGYSVIFAHSKQLGQFAMEVAPEFPDVYFFGDGVTTADNVSNSFGYTSTFHELNYVLGVLAASESNTGKVGYLLGFAYGSVIAGANGFYMGARSVNSDIVFTGTVMGVWTDQDKGREATQALIDTHHDFVYASSSDIGALQAGATSPGTYIFFTLSNKISVAPKAAMGGPLANHSRLLQHIIGLVQAGTLDENSTIGDLGPSIFRFSAAQGGSELLLNSDLYGNSSIVTPATQTLVNSTLDDLLDGTLTVPYNTTQMWS
jgi:basic membrane lipoprotein Med (substrate-binding protein (PBP1-ABC) superfamily)